MGRFALVDAMYRDGFQCSLCGLVMGETAELLAREYGISREASDAFALGSFQKAARAIAAGAFAGELAAVVGAGPKGPGRLLPTNIRATTRRSTAWRA